MQLRDYPYYANVMNAVMEGNHAMGVDTWINFTHLPQNILQALDSLNLHMKDSHATVVTKYFGKTAIFLQYIYMHVCIN